MKYMGCAFHFKLVGKDKVAINVSFNKFPDCIRNCGVTFSPKSAFGCLQIWSVLFPSLYNPERGMFRMALPGAYKERDSSQRARDVLLDLHEGFYYIGALMEGLVYLDSTRFEDHGDLEVSEKDDYSIDIYVDGSIVFSGKTYDDIKEMCNLLYNIGS